MGELFPVTLAEALEELEQVYVRLLGTGRLTQERADRQTRRLEAAIAYLGNHRLLQERLEAGDAIIATETEEAT